MSYIKKSKKYFLNTNNFFQETIIKAVLNIKKSAAIANYKLGNINEDIYKAIISSINILSEKTKKIKVQVFQTGSGTGLNMIINELISFYAKKYGHLEVHPNDHVNKGQSSNDVIPSAIRIAIYEETIMRLVPALESLIEEIEKNYKKFLNVIKPGRTHLRDALPVTLGLEFLSYHEKFVEDLKNIRYLSQELLKLPIGGTAVGTGYFTSNKFTKEVIKNLREIYGFNFKNPRDKGEKMKFYSDIYMVSSAIAAVSIDLNRFAQDIRLMYSGPNTGLNEIDIRNMNIEGSSIMPGKTNPVTIEAIMLSGSQILGINRAIENACMLGEFELGMGIPLIGYDAILEIELLTESLKGFSKVLKNIYPNIKKLKRTVFESPEIYMVLTKTLGYDKVSKIIREIIRKKDPEKVLKKYNLDKKELMALIKKEFKIKIQ